MPNRPSDHGTRLALCLASTCFAASTTLAGTPLPEKSAFDDLPAIAQATPVTDALTSADSLALLDAPQSAPAPAARPRRAGGAMTALLKRLVERGVLPKEDGEELIQVAEEEAEAIRAEAAAETAAAIAEAVPPQASPTAKRVTYIPETVKSELRDQIKSEVLAQARNENWAAPRTAPEWTSRMRVFGDVRIRGEGISYPDGNDNTGAFPNFNAINTGKPFDVSGTTFSPQYNVDQERRRARLRARFGIEADLSDGFTAGVRIGTGENNSPVSANQSLGLASQGQGGNFSKYAIWLDRGYLRYELGSQPTKNLSIYAGRFDNPFFSTTTVWSNELGFDGLALRARYEVARGFTPFLAGGAFPVFNTDLNFATNQPTKFKSDDKYLYGVQGGFDWKISKDFTAKFGAAYYYFDNITGRLSDPFIPLSADDQGNTDNSRPSFAQKGNTYRALRNIIPDELNGYGTTNQFQYFGLASEFKELALTGRLEYNRFEPVQISLTGEYVKNLAFDHDAINAVAVNNRGPNSSSGALGNFDGGDTAWYVDLKVGSQALEKRWDWNVNLGYRYVESDAVVDGFNDQDFGGGGTNMKGFTLGGALALGKNVWLGARWFSADEIAGPPLKSDVLQFDINGKF